MTALQLEVLEGEMTVCQVSDGSGIDWSGGLLFVGQTDEELSVVCRTECVPGNALRREDGWRAFRIRGQLDFSLTGILSGIARILAEEKIGIFAVSTYNTDYVLTKMEDFGRALDALSEHGYEICGQPEGRRTGDM